MSTKRRGPNANPTEEHAGEEARAEAPAAPVAHIDESAALLTAYADERATLAIELERPAALRARVNDLAKQREQLIAEKQRLELKTYELADELRVAQEEELKAHDRAAIARKRIAEIDRLVAAIAPVLPADQTA